MKAKNAKYINEEETKFFFFILYRRSMLQLQRKLLQAKIDFQDKKKLQKESKIEKTENDSKSKIKKNY